METGNWLAAMSGGLAAFLAGLMQYRHAQRWKRAEFVANEMKEFKEFRSMEHSSAFAEAHAETLIA